MLAAAQSAHIIALAASRSALWLILVYVAVRHRAPLSLTVVALSWIANVLGGMGYVFAQQLVAFPFVGLTVYLLVDRLLHKKSHLRTLLGAREADWSRERHELRNELAASAAREALLRAEQNPPTS